MSGNDFDYDVMVVGSGFGGSVAALRATGKGYKLGVLAAGKPWPNEDTNRRGVSPSLLITGQDPNPRLIASPASRS